MLCLEPCTFEKNASSHKIETRRCHHMSVLPRLVTIQTSASRPPKIMANSTLACVSSIHGSCFEAATLLNHNLSIICQMFLELFSDTGVLNHNTVRFDENRNFSHNRDANPTSACTSIDHGRLGPHLSIDRDADLSAAYTA